MYASVRNRPAEAERPAVRRGRRVAPTVVLLGAVSLFTDISQEMVTAALPLYLTFGLGLTPVLFGLVDGLYQGASAIVRLLGGLVADRRGRHKEVAAFGYGASALCKLGLLVAGGWIAITGVLMLDRLGKGIRTAPRDAMISLSSDRRMLGVAFGVHRAMDTVGAMLGPLVAFALLATAPHGYHQLFFISFCIALIGLAILVLFVRNPTPAAVQADEPDATGEPPASLRTALALLRDRRLRAVVVVGGLFALLTVSDAFVYLVVQRRTAMDPQWFPLLFLGTALSYLSLAVPLGQLADRFGRGRVFVAGHVALLGVYALLVLGDLSLPVVFVVLTLLGTYYACTDGVLMALASTAIPGHLRTSGLALVSTVTAAGRFASSVAFGALWMAFDGRGAVVVMGVALILALPVGGTLLARHRALA